YLITCFPSLSHSELPSLHFFYNCSVHSPYLHSFPTRRSSDLPMAGVYFTTRKKRSSKKTEDQPEKAPKAEGKKRKTTGKKKPHADRKSTRLNSSHVSISYAVFCLKKKKNNPKHCV